MIEVFELLIGAGKIIGRAKAIKNVSDFVTEDREAKRKERERQEEKKNLHDSAETIRNRSFFEALLMYIIAGIAGIFCFSWGIVGIIIVLLFYIVHLDQLTKVSKLTPVRREVILSVILAAVFLISII